MASETKDERDRFLSTRWTNVYLPAAVRAKKRFQADADEVDRYFRSSHDHLYEEVNQIMSSEGMFTLTINLAAQIRGYMGPHLYARHPVRTVIANTTDTVARWFAKVADVYLNAVPYETELKEAIRGSIDDALLAGRGVGIVTKDEDLDVVTTRQVAIDDLLIDPDARCLADAQWIAVRHVEPTWIVKKRYKTGQADDPTKGLVYNSTSWDPESGINKENGQLLDMGDARFRGQTSELTTYYKIWTKFGSGLLHGRGGKNENKPAEFDMNREKGNRYRYMVIVPGHVKPLYEGDWPIPMHLDSDWPIGLLDFTPTRLGDKKDPMWPVSLMKLGLSHQKAIDILCTILLSDLRFKSRTVAGVLGEKAEDVKEALTNGDLHVAFNLDPTDGVTDIRQIFQLLELGEVSPQLIPTIDWHERKFGEITGLLPLLKGATPGSSGDTQMRSAMEASVRDRNSRSRLEDMNERCESFNSAAAKREFIALRLVCSAKEVESVVNEKLPPAPFKVKVALGLDVLTIGELKTFYPPAARYFDDPQEAEAVQQQLLGQDRAMIELAWSAANKESKTPALLRANVTQVSVEELWSDTAGLEAKDLARGYKVKIEAGSARREDWELLKDQAAFLMQEIGQRAAAMGDLNTYNRCADRVQQIMQIPRQDRIYMDVQLQSQQAEGAQKEEQEKMQQDFQRKAQLEIAKQDVKDRGSAQQIVLKGEIDSGLQGQRFAYERALDTPGGGGWR